MFMKLQESTENYLKTILLLQRKQGYVRATDIAESMQYTKASISRAVKLLKEKGYLYQDAHKMIFLTTKGEEKAVQIYERHQFFVVFLTEVLQLDQQIAEQDACRMEHVVSDSTFRGFQQLYEKMK